jgi:hypothetical protein
MNEPNRKPAPVYRSRVPRLSIREWELMSHRRRQHREALEQAELAAWRDELKAKQRKGNSK